MEPVRRSIDFFFTNTLLTREEFVLIESIFDLVFQAKVRQLFLNSYWINEMNLQCERVNEFLYLMNRRFRKGLKTFAGFLAIAGMLIFIASPMIFFATEDLMTDHNHMKYLSIELESPIIGNMFHQRTTSFQQYMNYCIVIRPVFNYFIFLASPNILTL